MSIFLYYTNMEGKEIAFLQILNFSFKKEVYTPYTTLSAVVMSPDIPHDIQELHLYLNETLLHQGPVDSYMVKEENGFKKAVITSRGYTSLLTENQLAPGMYTDISFNKLFEDYFTLPFILHENNDDLSYIFVNKGTAMWDGASNLSYKLTGKYPYIRNANMVMMNMPSDAKTRLYNDDQIISRGTELSTRRIVSHYHMADLSGNYDTYNSVSEDAVARNIIRHHHFELDRRFLNSPQSACDYRTMMSMRGYKRKFFTYSGYNGDDLNDLVAFSDTDSELVKAVKVNGSKRGIFTEISIYDDYSTNHV